MILAYLINISPHSAGDLPHSSSEVRKRDEREESESTPGG